jgi:DNA-binding response OmpR family regulator
MVHGFARQSGGNLAIRSRESQGTEITVFLPRSSEAAGPLSDLSGVPIARGTGRILLVEDEPDVGEAAAALLTELGYEVVHVVDSDAALRHLEDGSGFALLVTDVMMAGRRSGWDLGRLAKSRWSDLCVLYLSGDPEKVAQIRSALSDRDDVMAKPYHYRDLGERVAALLSRPLPTDRED